MAQNIVTRLPTIETPPKIPTVEIPTINTPEIPTVLANKKLPTDKVTVEAGTSAKVVPNTQKHSNSLRDIAKILKSSGTVPAEYLPAYRIFKKYLGYVMRYLKMKKTHDRYEASSTEPQISSQAVEDGILSADDMEKLYSVFSKSEIDLSLNHFIREFYKLKYLQEIMNK
jgi:hypothetical protein